MPDRDEVASRLAQLEADGATGCLTISSTSHGKCLVYLLGGQVLLVKGPSVKGDAALTEALAWANVRLSFDDSAEPPTEESSTGNTSDIQPLQSSVVATLSDDRRLANMGRALQRSTGLLIAAPTVVIVLAILANVVRVIDLAAMVGAIGLAVILFVVFVSVWVVMLVRFRHAFVRAAVAIPDGLPDAAIPSVVEAAAGVIAGKPTVVLKMRVRSSTGPIARCRVELYPHGLQIWRGPGHPEPRWQFSYGDLLQAESIDLVSPFTPAGSPPDQYFVRLIADHPRMAFLFGNTWFGTAGGQNRSARLLINKLRQHQVPTFEGSFDS